MEKVLTSRQIVAMASDLVANKARGNFSQGDNSEALRQALIAANGGSDIVDYRNLRRNKSEIYDIIEEIVPVITREGLSGDEFYMNLVEERSLATGDKNEFVVDDNSTFIVSKIADGINYARRQRIGEKTSVAIDTHIYAITIYEEFSLFMSGKRDWNTFVNKVAEAFKQMLYNKIYATFAAIDNTTQGMNSTYATGGTYDETALLTLIEHVEAATGKNAIIVGTRTALRKCNSAVLSQNAQDAYYNTGFYGKLAGVPMVAIKNKHVAGTDNFVFPDNKVYVLASDDKPIKVVYEGNGIITETDGASSADGTMSYTYKEKIGVGLLINGKLGVYTMS